MRGSSRGCCDKRRGGAHGGPQTTGGRRVFYEVLERTDSEDFDAIIIGIVLVCNHSTLQFYLVPDSIYSYVSTGFSFDIAIMCELLAEPICVSTLIGESLMENQVYWGYVVTFSKRDIVADLILLDMVYFDVMLVMD